MEIARSLIDEIVAHAREDAPNECCGLVAGRDDVATRVFRARNEMASPRAYNVHPQDLLRITSEIEHAGEELAAIYHSHTRSDPVPSQTDINLAFYPDSVYLIVGVKGSEPDLRLWSIVGNTVEQVELTVTE